MLVLGPGDLVVWKSPYFPKIRGKIPHRLPKHKEHHILFLSSGMWNVFICAFLLRMNVQSFNSVEVRFWAGFGWMVLVEQEKVLCFVNRMSDPTPDNPTPVAGLDPLSSLLIYIYMFVYIYIQNHIAHLQKVTKSWASRSITLVYYGLYTLLRDDFYNFSGPLPPLCIYILRPCPKVPRI